MLANGYKVYEKCELSELTPISVYNTTPNKYIFMLKCTKLALSQFEVIAQNILLKVVTAMK